MSSPVVFIVARVLLASVFVGLGLSRLFAAAGIGAVPGEAVSVGVLVFSAVELVAGLVVMLGWQARWIALVLAAFLLVDAVLAHPFWRFEAAEQQDQLLHFLKNIGLVGGLLLLVWGETVRKGLARARL